MLHHLAFFDQYGLHLTSGAFPVLTSNRRHKKTTDMEIILIGDSHGWGQGAPGYDLQAYYSAHMAAPNQKGVFAQVQSYLERKLDIYPLDAVPLLAAGSGTRLVRGTIDQAQVPIDPPAGAQAFYCSREAAGDSAIPRLGYLAGNRKFGDEVSILTGELCEEGVHQAELIVDLRAPARKLYVGLIRGSRGAKMEIALRPSPYLPVPSGYPRVYEVKEGQHVEMNGPEVEYTESGCVRIDTYEAEGHREQVICLDYGQQQLGVLSIRMAGASERGGVLSAEQPALMLRGIVFNGNHVRNFSMGGHTVGQWLGDGTSSFHDASYPHMDEILAYVPFTPTLAIIQAPVVNEYVRQTPIPAYMNNLEQLIDKLNSHYNPDGARKLDVLVLTTLGDRRIEFEGQTSFAITYDDYFHATKQFCLSGGYGFIDFRQYFCDMARAGMLDYELLYDDATHPGPFAHTCIARALADAIDLLM